MTTESPIAIYVDVDDTLTRSGGSKRIPVPAALALVRASSARGADLYLWSTAGSAYARQAADALGVADCFKAFLPKPQVLLDDQDFQRWGALEIHPLQCLSQTADELLAWVEEAGWAR